MRANRSSQQPRIWFPLGTALLFLAASLLLVSVRPSWILWIALVDGLVVGIVLGATGLARSYDDSWDEFWETAAIAYLFGIFSLLIYWIRRESPSAFFIVECAAGFIGYLMLLFVPPLEWIAADSILFLGTFVGWFFSGFFRPEYY